MKIISEKVSTTITTMTIINAEKGAFGPCLTGFWWLGLRSHNVENDGDTVFIIISDDSLVGICTVSSYNAVSFG